MSKQLNFADKIITLTSNRAILGRIVNLDKENKGYLDIIYPMDIYIDYSSDGVDDGLEPQPIFTLDRFNPFSDDESIRLFVENILCINTPTKEIHHRYIEYLNNIINKATNKSEKSFKISNNGEMH